MEEYLHGSPFSNHRQFQDHPYRNWPKPEFQQSLPKAYPPTTQQHPSSHSSHHPPPRSLRPPYHPISHRWRQPIDSPSRATLHCFGHTMLCVASLAAVSRHYIRPLSGHNSAWTHANIYRTSRLSQLSVTHFSPTIHNVGDGPRRHGR